MDDDNFFSPEGEPRRAQERRVARAKAVCQVCPVIEQCRVYAVQTGELYGVWGGLSQEERRQQVA